MRFRKAAEITILISVLSVSAVSTSVINSGDWREVIVAKNMAELKGEETFTVVNPSDAKVAENTVESPETLYTVDSPAFRNISRKTGLKFERVKKVSWKNFSRQAEGFVVVGKEFGTDAVSVLPYANRRNYSIVFYREGVREFLMETSRPKTFYGINPKGFPESERITGGWQDRNLEIAGRIGGKWAVISPRGYFDPSELDEKPVLFRMNRRKLADFLENSTIDNLKVVGPENMLYAKEIDILSQKDLEIVAKTGRAFTGISDFQGIYGLKKVKTSFRRYSLELAEVSASEGVVNLEFVNGGNTVRVVEGNAGGKDFRIVMPEFSSVQRSVNLSNRSDFTVSYSTDRSSDSESYSLESLREEESRPLTELDVKDSYIRGGSLIIELKNTGERDVWTLIHTDDDYSRKFVPAGEDENLTLSDASNESFTIYHGRFDNQYTYSEVRRVGSSSQTPDFMVELIVVMAILLIVAAGYVVYEFTR